MSYGSHNMLGGLAAAAQADENAKAQRRKEFSIIDSDLMMLVENARRIAYAANALLADALSLNERVRKVLQDSV